jgi:hypothetical protein
MDVFSSGQWPNGYFYFSPKIQISVYVVHISHLLSLPADNYQLWAGVRVLVQVQVQKQKLMKMKIGRAIFDFEIFNVKKGAVLAAGGTFFLSLSVPKLKLT